MAFLPVQLRPCAVPAGPVSRVSAASSGSSGPVNAPVAGGWAGAVGGRAGAVPAGAKKSGPAVARSQARGLWWSGAIVIPDSSRSTPADPAAESSRNCSATGSGGSACPFAVKYAPTAVRRSLQVSGVVTPLAARVCSRAQKPRSSASKAVASFSSRGP
ncbi:hypothetical protein ID875_00505 [Streptomyces globisporus]|uniref:Uncharacterized protein n=1 Tax=Streptomyces globisporus TaxID=1908 RepID=A0A927GLW9_STRGL|nr:hypothetical protein [Streptomyces globisporus]